MDETNDDKWDDSELVMVDRSGVYRHRVRWCRCQASDNPQWQLLKMGLFPATFKQPRTAFMFDVLDYFHIDQVECKTSANNFFTKLRRLTDNAFPHTVPVCLLNWIYIDDHVEWPCVNRTDIESS
jgi:hypothetical protein